jgi:hypothetical protein
MYPFHTYPLFTLDGAYEFGVATAKHLREDLIHGDFITADHDAGLMAQAIAKAGNGDHLEIGTLYGGSAILAAMTKQKFGLDGKVYCVDPLTGYYDEPRPGMVDRVFGNMKTCHVEDRIILTEAKSFPFPEALAGQKFVTSFIDGDHTMAGAYSDWLNVYPLTSHFVLFDNYDYEHPDSGPRGGTVLDAAGKVMRTMGEHPWFPVYIGGITIIFSKWDTL